MTVTESVGIGATPTNLRDTSPVSTPVDLGPHLCNRGIQPAGAAGGFGFNIWSNTFPAEELPPPGTVSTVDGVPFAFPPAPAPGGDNVRCRGQLVTLPGTACDWLYLLGAAERRTEDELELHHADGTVDTAWLRMSDFWPETPTRFGDALAARTTGMRYPRHTQRPHAPAVWQQRVGVRRTTPLVAVRLPDNPAMHVFALTVVEDPEARCAR